MMYRTYDRMGDDKKQAIREDSRRFLKGLAP
jgi:deoxyribodipyrimidine photolyase-related protein